MHRSGEDWLPKETPEYDIVNPRHHEWHYAVGQRSTTPRMALCSRTAFHDTTNGTRQ
ncbi:hypothetical protein DPMN_090307 [Dreissena polymorpha]|uniref:Uncharacterized protein n=1 Tax=Dreissena polymorpha TaxID=45954 RepID=A0A9D4KXX0_DREPO|nr:hypothetical protein DPMN_090307 [Dreissena polymorpha]